MSIVGCELFLLFHSKDEWIVFNFGPKCCRSLLCFYYILLIPILRHQMLETLNEEELKGYNRFKLETWKNQFLIGRYLIKSVWSPYLKEDRPEINNLKKRLWETVFTEC